MKSTNRKTLIAAAVASALLAGCSGGSGSGSGVSVSTVTGAAATGYFKDATVAGASYLSGAGTGVTDDHGAFQHTIDGYVQLKVGSKVNLGVAKDNRPDDMQNDANPWQVSPLQLVGATADDRIAKAMASLLQSLDADGKSSESIELTPAMIMLLEQRLGDQTIDFTTWDDEGFDIVAALTSLEEVLTDVVQAAVDDGDDSTTPIYVDPDTAGDVMLGTLVQENLLKKNISKTPEQNTDKVGVDFLEPITVSVDGVEQQIHPLITAYADGGLDGNRVWDPYIAVSYDNGLTWKRKNLFKKAGKEMTIHSTTFYAKSGGPSMAVAGPYILVSWISTFCQGGPDFASGGGVPDTLPAGLNPAKELLGDLDTTEYVTDWFKVLGKQGTVTYTFDTVPPTYLTNPYYCVWAARGVQQETPDEDGNYIVWRAPEQLTSGVRDAKLDWPAVVAGEGFGLVWQEDPEGLLPGEGEGPGVGWSGATTHHKTDIWYSFLNWADFDAVEELVDVDDTDVVDSRPKVATTFSVPIPVSNNNSCRTDGSGTLPLYCDKTQVPETPYCVSTQEVEIQLGGGGGTGIFCVTADGDVLDGDTGASRPNMHWAAKYDALGNVIGARALITYEETKGLCEEGGGCPDAPYDTGKFVMYHHIPDFKLPHVAKTGENVPQIVNQGDILSHPVKYATTDPLVDFNMVLNTDALMTPDEYCAQSDFCEEGDSLYENARRERFVVNSDPNHPVKLVVIYKQGYYNQGERADIFARRLVGGWEIENFSPPLCASCVMPTETEYADTSSGTATTKVVAYDWQTDYVDHESWFNPFDDARSLRAKLDGDRMLIAYGWTPNWLLSTILGGDGYFKDNFDFMVRRSFNVDSGYVLGDNETVTFLEGANRAIFFEPPVNTSNLANNKVNQVEPRLVTVAGSMMTCPTFTEGVDQDPSLCEPTPGTVDGYDKFIVTYCTAENTEREGPDGRPIHAPGLDCFFSWTFDNGETFVAKDEDGDGDVDFECLACNNDLEEVEPEVILTSDGMTMHAGWAVNGPLDDSSSDVQNGSDAWYGQWLLCPEDMTGITDPATLERCSTDDTTTSQ